MNLEFFRGKWNFNDCSGMLDGYFHFSFSLALYISFNGKNEYNYINDFKIFFAFYFFLNILLSSGIFWSFFVLWNVNFGYLLLGIFLSFMRLFFHNFIVWKSALRMKFYDFQRLKFLERLITLLSTVSLGK